MTSYEGRCHCGAVSWNAVIPEENHILWCAPSSLPKVTMLLSSQLTRRSSHCNACKVIGGGEYTLNQIIPKDNFKVTRGDLKSYTYKGDSGTPLLLSPFFYPVQKAVLTLFHRELCRLLLLRKLHRSCLSPPACHGQQHRDPDVALERDREMGQAGCRDLRGPEMELAATDSRQSF